MGKPGGPKQPALGFSLGNCISERDSVNHKHVSTSVSPSGSVHVCVCVHKQRNSSCRILGGRKDVGTIPGMERRPGVLEDGVRRRVTETRLQIRQSWVMSGLGGHKEETARTAQAGVYREGTTLERGHCTVQGQTVGGTLPSLPAS